MGKGSNQTVTQSSSTNTTRPDDQAYNLYSQLLSRAQGVANTPYQPYGGELVAPVNAQQTTGISNINSAFPGYQTAFNQAQTASQPLSPGQIQQYMSPYTQQVVDATQNQFNNQNAIAQRNLKGNAIAQGALGGNRLGVAQGVMAGQQQLAQAPVIAGLYNSGYQNAVNTAQGQQQIGLSGAGQMAGINNSQISGANAQIGAGSLQQQTQQAQNAANYQQFQNQLAYPFQTTQWLAGLGTGVGSQMGGTTTGSGTQTTQGPTPSPFSQIFGGVTGGLGLLGQSGAFGASGWLAPAMAMLARGGRVPGFAQGGGVANLPELPETLGEQQNLLAEGLRPAQMFPHGTDELPVPPGMGRTQTGNGVVHYNPEMMSEGDIQGLSAQNRENDFLDLGPFSKEDIQKLVEQGEEPIALVERTPQGVEVRAALGTQSTLPVQLKHFEKTKAPGNTLKVEPLGEVLGQRAEGLAEAPGRAAGGGMGGMPYSSSGVAGWVPTLDIARGQGVAGLKPYQMPSVKAPDAQKPYDLGAGIKNIGGFLDSAKAGYKEYQALNKDPEDPTNTTAEAGGQSVSNDNPTMFNRGGGVLGFDDGGTVPFEVPDDGERPATVGVAAAEPANYVPRGVEVNPQPTRASIQQEIIAAANQYGVPPELALKVARQESRFNQNAVSPKGARGVMQLMPGTAEELGVDPYDVNANIHGGMRYLAQQYKKYGEWPLALAAYNAGPGRMDKVLAGNSSLPDETRDYVQKIAGVGLPVGNSGVSASPVVPAAVAAGAAKASGVAPPSNGPDLSAESKLWPALAAAGFGMMSSRSPFPGVAIGEGATHGLQVYQNLRKEELQRGQNQQRIDLEAKRLSQQADQFGKTHGLAQARAVLEEKKQRSEELHRRMQEKRPFIVGHDPRTMNPIYGIADPTSPQGYRIMDPKELRNPATQPPAPPPATSGAKPNERVAENEAPPVWETGGAQTAEAALPVRNYGEDYNVSAQSAKTDKNTGDYIEKLVDDADRLYRRKIRQRWNTDILDAAKEQDPEVARLAESILEGRQPVPKALTGKYSAQNRAAMELVRAVDPDFDEGYYAAKNKARQEFTQGVAGRQTRAFNTAMGHIAEMYMLGRELDNYESGLFGPATKLANTVVGKYREGTQDPRINTYKTTAQAVASELAKAFRGAGGTALKEIEEWKEAIGDPRITPQQLLKGTQNLLHLLGSQIESSASQMAVGLRAPIDSKSLLTAQNREIYNRIMNGQQPIIEKYDTMEKAKEALEKKRLQVGDEFAGPDGKVRKLTEKNAEELRTGKPATTAPAPAQSAPAPKPDAKTQAMEWIAKNPNDPRVPAIKKQYGIE